jgi:formimidoylglutamate deiminase
MPDHIIEPELTWTGPPGEERFERNVRIAVENGRISEVGALSDEPTHRLPRTAILPGFVNTHSHAFQRGLRGRGETFPEEAGDFWSWREEMYRLVKSMDEQRIYELSRQTFSEMLDAGITAVGEFHYLHHSPGTGDFALDKVVLRAAADAGIRIVLLNVLYRAGGLGPEGHTPLSDAQQRFAAPSVDAFWEQMDRLAEVVAQGAGAPGLCGGGGLSSLGVAAHSIRAVPLDELIAFSEEAARRGMPLHMHVEEQPREVEDALHHYGRTPMGLLNAHLRISPLFTAVHCTHTSTADLDDYLSAGGNICICPLTEANLGDGLANVPWMLRHDGRVCLGSDSNSRIDMAEEMRWLEYGQRLATLSRGVCVNRASRGAGHVAERLLHAATIAGARAIGLRTGAIRPGFLADLVALDLDHPPLAGADAETLLPAFLCGSDGGAVAGTFVNGTWREKMHRTRRSLSPRSMSPRSMTGG